MCSEQQYFLHISMIEYDMYVANAICQGIYNISINGMYFSVKPEQIIVE